MAKKINTETLVGFAKFTYDGRGGQFLTLPPENSLGIRPQLAQYIGSYYVEAGTISQMLDQVRLQDIVHQIVIRSDGSEDLTKWRKISYFEWEQLEG